MGRKSLHVVLAMFWLLWTAIIIPSHTPGMLQLSGDSTAASHGSGQSAGANISGGCPLCVRSRSNGSSLPDRKPAGCVICDFKAKVTTNTVVLVNLRFLELLQRTVICPPAAVPDRALILTSDSRAPPLASATEVV